MNELNYKPITPKKGAGEAAWNNYYLSMGMHYRMIAQQENDETPDDLDLAESFDNWMERFSVLAEQARQEGYTVIVAMCTYDPLEDKSWRAYLRKGDYYAAMGLLSLVSNESEGDV